MTVTTAQTKELVMEIETTFKGLKERIQEGIEAKDHKKAWKIVMEANKALHLFNVKIRSYQFEKETDELAVDSAWTVACNEIDTLALHELFEKAYG